MSVYRPADGMSPLPVIAVPLLGKMALWIESTADPVSGRRRFTSAKFLGWMAPLGIETAGSAI